MIRLDKSEDGLWRVTIARPDKANSLTRAMLVELAEIAEAAQDSRAIILTGEGKVFSAGMDLEAAKTGLATDPVWERLSGAIAALPGLSIAALNGTVAGGAIGMVLACDLRLSVASAKIFYPVMRLGFLPQPSDPGRLVQLIGLSRAKTILMAGQKIEAEQALQWGLFDKIVEAQDLLDTAKALCADTLSATADHAAAIKALCQRTP